MDKTFEGSLDFRDVVRFGYFMAVEAKRLPNDGGEALRKLFERAKPMLAHREPAGEGRNSRSGGVPPAACNPMTS